MRFALVALRFAMESRIEEQQIVNVRQASIFHLHLLRTSAELLRTKHKTTSGRNTDLIQERHR